MIEIKMASSKRDISKFVNFPIKLYKGNPYFVPFLSGEEKQNFNKKASIYTGECEMVAFLAMEDKKIVGRIAGIIQHAYNKKTNKKCVRFSRFDCIDNQEVANKLFEAVEEWAKKKDMNCIHGPLGFNDLDREGLLIEGFDQLGTFEEQYNYEYYPKLVENYGFEKEIDWIEYRVHPPKEINQRFKKVADEVLRRYNLNTVYMENRKKFVEKYADSIFDVVNSAYAPLHGVVPISNKVKDAVIKQFLTTLDKRYTMCITDENDVVVGFGLAIPSMSKSVQKSKGRLFPFGFIRILRELKSTKVLNFALIAIRPDYQNKGLNAIILHNLINTMIENEIEYAETNLMLENNDRIQAQWESFNFIQNKRRRCYIKPIKK